MSAYPATPAVGRAFASNKNIRGGRMDVQDRLRFGPLLEGDVHICVAMQRLFAEDTAWHTPRMERVLPKVLRVARAHPDRTMFTRFVPACTPGEASGAWVRYDERWASMTRERLRNAMVDLVPERPRLCRPRPCSTRRSTRPGSNPTSTGTCGRGAASPW